MDFDLEQLNRDELIAEVKRLRTGIRAHRDDGFEERLAPWMRSGLQTPKHEQQVEQCGNGGAPLGTCPVRIHVKLDINA